MKEFFQKKWVKSAGIVLLCIVLVYLLIYIDVLMRARSAYLEGEKYWRWHENPQEKQQELFAGLQEEKEKLSKELSKDKISQDDYNKQVEIAEFNYEQKLNESSIKYAYIWYQTVVELFSPPESKWVRLSREKMPRAKELWKKQLTEKGIPFEDYMLE
ncbi:MAG: hypothetical protein JW871_02430 [Endomicrobiales bacterium]|nr:hypothetical protein [Endomicrobiales bacterium]